MWDIDASMEYDNSLYSSDSNSFEDLEEEGEFVAAFDEEHEALNLRSAMKNSSAPKCLDAAPHIHSATVTKTSDTLTSIITAQQADGSWKLNSTVTQLLAIPQNEVEKACPVKCIASIWATVLILTLLKKKYSSQQDEWELIAMKAESWVKKQSLPSGLTIKELYSAAELLI